MDPDIVNLAVVIGGAAALVIVTAFAQLLHEKSKYIHDQNQREAELHCQKLCK